MSWVRVFSVAFLLTYLMLCRTFAEVQYRYTARLNWGEAKNVEVYRVQVLRADGEPVQELATRAVTVDVNLAPGEYLYRIQHEDSIGRRSRWSPVAPFVVRPGPPVLEKIRENIFDGTSSTLRWLPPAGADKYHIQLWKEGSLLIDEDTSEPKFSTEFKKSGEYQYQVAAFVNGVMGEYSQRAHLPVFDSEYKQKIFLNVGAGLTLLEYSETLESDLVLAAVTPKLSMRYPLSQNWDLGANTYITGQILQSTREEAIRFLGSNLRLGFLVPLGLDRIRLSVMGGLYYTTTFVSKNQFGFQNMSGPQLFPTLSARLSEKNTVYTYLKYSPIMDQLVPTFRSKEFATGMGWVRSGGPFATWSLSLDFGSLSINISDLLFITSRSLTLGLDLGW